MLLFIHVVKSSLIHCIVKCSFLDMWSNHLWYIALSSASQVSGSNHLWYALTIASLGLWPNRLKHCIVKCFSSLMVKSSLVCFDNSLFSLVDKSSLKHCIVKCYSSLMVKSSLMHFIFKCFSSPMFKLSLEKDLSSLAVKSSLMHFIVKCLSSLKVKSSLGCFDNGQKL